MINNYKHQKSRHWKVDETYIKVKGKWQYLYRAVDKYGQTIDFLMTAKRDTAAALKFFKKAMNQHDTSEVVTIGKHGTNTDPTKQIF